MQIKTISDITLLDEIKYEEKYGDYTIYVYFASNGNLSVLVFDKEITTIWSGSNILKARAFVVKKLKKLLPIQETVSA